MNVEKVFEELKENYKNEKYKENEELLSITRNEMKRLRIQYNERIQKLHFKIQSIKEKEQELKTLYKSIKPRLCNVCLQFKNVDCFGNGMWYKVCNKCKNNKDMKEYTLEECIKFSLEFNAFLEERYIMDETIKQEITEYAKNTDFTELLEKINKYPINDKYSRLSIDGMWLNNFTDTSFWLKKYSYDKTVYNKLGNLYVYINTKLSKCRKLTKKEKRDIDKHINGESDEE